ncbi:hypothetical protein PYCCODRAFT_1465840 [Trametes coccinea BRFM310]|uniref:Zn(2)-C6 fungal-type domain-containing protein n=1 Tax=Trametes coccinea (strain BRFM310) TaxID=1353009 RepID=A0A1Y2IUS3_TRAC3|nr:hypothetical protein PYCCODRAFT_1465840 [Trametes coccinea BRFM310]
MSSLIQPSGLLPCLFFYSMDRRQQYHDGSTQTPQQQTPDDVLQWIDSVSGHAQSNPAAHYNWPVGQWPPESAAAPYYPPGAQHFQQFQQGSSNTPAGATRGQGYPQSGQGYPHAGQSYPQTGYPYPQTGQQYPQTIMFSPAGPSQGHAAYEEHGDSYRDSSPSYTETGSVGSSSKGKPKIALDPSQPLTTDGKPRARVFVACDRCRVRKLRCDGAKPVCYNCQKVAHTGVECVYDPAPKRRGQDKAPRTRSAVGQRKPRRPAPKKGDAADDASGQGQYPSAYQGA